MPKAINYVELQGILANPKLSYTNDSGYPRFQATIEVPAEVEFSDGTTKTLKNYYNILAWGALALDMEDVAAKTWVKVTGSIQTKKYDSSCEKCGLQLKKYWTDIVISNFKVIEDE